MDIQSAAQDEWVEIAEALRTHLHKLGEFLPAMAIDEQRDYVDMCTAVYWLEHNALTFDHQVEAALRKPFGD